MNLNTSLNASEISESLYPLKWITPNFENPKKEFLIIKKFLEEINNESDNVLLISNYNFIDSIIEKKLFLASRNYDVTIPSKKNKFFYSFKNQLLTKINEQNIKTIFIFSPQKAMSLRFRDNLLSYFDEKCFDIKNIDIGIDKITFKKC